MDKKLDEAQVQITNTKYAKKYKLDNHEVINYVISFYKKGCKGQIIIIIDK